MILADPTLESIRDRVRDEGCPQCGERTADIQVIGYAEIILDCGHALEGPEWIEGELEEGPD